MPTHETIKMTFGSVKVATIGKEKLQLGQMMSVTPQIFCQTSEASVTSQQSELRRERR